MNVARRIAQDWPRMNAADRLRVVLACGFPLGAVLHVAWVIYHGDLTYRGPAPQWAPFFWYALCVVDFFVCWLLLARPRAGVLAAVATMTVTLAVNWTQFPTFEFQFNYVLIGLSAFGAIVVATATWLWRSASWTLQGFRCPESSPAPAEPAQLRAGQRVSGSPQDC